MVEAESPAHSTSVMCSTSVGRSMGCFGVLSFLEEIFQWSERVYWAAGSGGGGGSFVIFCDEN